MRVAGMKLSVSIIGLAETMPNRVNAASCVVAVPYSCDGLCIVDVDMSMSVQSLIL